MKCGTLFLCRDALVPIFTYIKSKWYYRCMTECQGRTCCLGDVMHWIEMRERKKGNLPLKIFYYFVFILSWKLSYLGLGLEDGQGPG